MPDTGAPWNIPYVESSDLVSDWPADSLALANAIDAGLDAAGSAGIGSAVVTATTTTSTSTTSSSYVDTALSATITPTSASSKVLIAVSGTHYVNHENASNFLGIFRGDAATGTELVTFARLRRFPGTSYALYANAAAVYLDSPATTSATTYTLAMKSASGQTATFLGPGGSGSGIMTLIEVAG